MIHLLADLVFRRVCAAGRAAGDPEKQPPASSATRVVARLRPDLLSPGIGLAWPEPLQESLRQVWAELAWRRVHSLTMEHSDDDGQDPTHPA